MGPTADGLAHAPWKPLGDVEIGELALGGHACRERRGERQRRPLPRTSDRGSGRRAASAANHVSASSRCVARECVGTRPNVTRHRWRGSATARSRPDSGSTSASLRHDGRARGRLHSRALRVPRTWLIRPTRTRSSRSTPRRTSEVIQAAYRRLAQKYHPDTATAGPLNRTRRARMVEVNAAWASLPGARRAGLPMTGGEPRLRLVRASAAHPWAEPAGPAAHLGRARPAYPAGYCTSSPGSRSHLDLPVPARADRPAAS